MTLKNLLNEAPLGLERKQLKDWGLKQILLWKKNIYLRTKYKSFVAFAKEFDAFYNSYFSTYKRFPKEEIIIDELLGA